MSHDSLQQVSSTALEKAEQQYRQGLKLLKEQKPKDAIRLLREALELNPSHKEAQSALREASEGLSWSKAYFCDNCGSLVTPEKEYPRINFAGFCLRCGREISTRREIAIGLAELFTKLILFAIFPVATFIFSVFPVWTYGGGFFRMEMTNVLSAIFTAISFTPFFILLLLIFDPHGGFLTHAYYSLFDFMQPLTALHPLLFFTAEIGILFAAIYLSLLFLLTPIFYIHRKGYWKNKKHQKIILIVTSIFIALVVLRRLSMGVFD